jgi:hypothetical protein
VKKALTIVAIVLAVLVGLGVVADRGAVAVAQNAISDRVQQELPGAASVETEIDGFPVLTQAARGSLDHVTVRMREVPTEQGTLDSVTVDLYDVTTGEPRTAGRIEARAVVPLDVLQAQIGDSWEVAVDGDALTASFTGAVPVEATVVPVVRDGAITVDIRSISLLGVDIAGDSIPGFVTEALQGLIGSIGPLPFDLTPDSVVVTEFGVEVAASGTDVALG